MLTQSQRNAVFTNIGTAYTVDGHNYTAFKEYKERWSGEITTPVIMLEYSSQGRLKQGTIGKRAEWAVDKLSIDVFATTDHTNSINGSDIVYEITRTMELWFKGAAANALFGGDGMSVGSISPVLSLSFLEELIYRKHFEVDILYKLI